MPLEAINLEPVQILFSFALMIVGSFWGYFLNRILDQKSLPKIEASRRRSLRGCWHGVYKQDYNHKRPSVEIPIEIELKVGPRKVTGVMFVSDTSRFEFNLEGAFYHNKYLRLSYTAHGETEDVIDFGALFLVLGDIPNKMAGNVAGYGSMTEGLISGTVSLVKKVN